MAATEEAFQGRLYREHHGWLRTDPAVADLRVSGVFQLDDTDAALQSLAASLPVTVRTRTPFWVTVTLPSGAGGEQ